MILLIMILMILNQVTNHSWAPHQTLGAGIWDVARFIIAIIIIAIIIITIIIIIVIIIIILIII